MSAAAELHIDRPVWLRVAKFALVGAIGIGVQLGALQWFTSLGCSYLVATALAVETAILHNFVWHEHFTWNDRNQFNACGPGVRFLRFHISNGLISIVGNILLMRIFVGGFGMHVLSGNLASIAICCLTNFLASDRWVFAQASPD
jgi:putative flippase GtrA